MGQLHLHHHHPIFKQLKNVACPTCQMAITPKTPIAVETLEDGRYLVLHEKCSNLKVEIA